MQKTVIGPTSLQGVFFYPPVRWRAFTKTLLVMKLTVLLITAALFQVHASGVAQSVTISGKDLTLKQVFSAIKKQTGYVLFSNRETLSKTKKVSLAVNDMPLMELLKVVLKDQPVNYVIQGKTIMLYQKPAVVAPPEQPLVVESGALFPELAIPIKGIVRGPEGKPLAGVNIMVKGTSKGANSDNQGQFTIDAKPGDVLIISSIGFSPREIKISENTNIVVTLQVSNSPLDEVQIIAYGATTRRLNTGSVSTIKAEEIERQPVMNLQQALQGRVPGLEITISNGNAAAPVKMEIRGRNSLNPNVLSEPLYVIDGVPFNVLNVNKINGFMAGPPPETPYGMVQSGFSNTNGENILSFINPKDIESIDVLKDADATAIYGSRGSNGVILITTKKGKAGPTRFNLNITQGVLMIPKYLDFLSTEDYLDVRKEAFRNDGIIPTEGNAIDLLVWDQNRYTNWQKVLFGTGQQTQVSAGVSGGLNQTTYNINASYQSREELMNSQGRNGSSSLLLGIDHRSADQRFHVGLRSILSLTNSEAYDVGGGAGLPPNAPAMYNEEGHLNFKEWSVGSDTYYPFSGLKTPSNSKTHAVNTSMNIGFEVAKGLTLSATAGYSFGNNSNNRFQPLASFNPAYPFAVSQAYYGTTVNNVWSIEPQLTYNYHIGRGSLHVLAGAALQTNTTSTTTMIGMGYPDDNLINSINNAMSVMAIDGYAEHKYTAGFARVTYNWANKYILNLNARRDGSSRFGPGKQFGNFGSAGIAWIASEEKWMKNILPAWASFLKFRGSYGTTGGNGVGDYQYLTRWSTTANEYGSKWEPYGGIPGILIKQPINQQFQWESSTQLEAAIELSLFDDMVNMTALYYRKRSGNQLTEIPTPAYTGFESVVANWEAFVQNSGFEFSASARIVNSNSFSLTGRFNISVNRNKLLDYPNIDRSPYATRYQVGKSLSSRYYLHYTGIDPVRGTATFEDRNKDGTISAYTAFKPGDPDADRYVAIDLTPEYSGGFGLQFAYKQFSVDMFFMFRKQLGNNPYMTLVPGSRNNVILPDEIKYNHWQYPGDIALYPKYSNSVQGPIRESDIAFVDASFVKLGNLAISYELPEKWMSKMKIRSCRISIQTHDLFYITAYKGPNPEVQQFTGVSPIPRLIAGSLTFNF